MINKNTYRSDTCTYVVYVPYCDGASFSGNNDTTQPAGNYTLHWRGWRIFNGVWQLLQKQYNLNSATDVLMSGCSAGGTKYKYLYYRNGTNRYVINRYQN